MRQKNLIKSSYLMLALWLLGGIFSETGYDTGTAYWRQGNLEIVKVASYFFVENDVLLSIYVTPCTSRPHLIVQLKASVV